MPDRPEIAMLVDRFVRRLHADLHHRALDVDVENVGPFGGMILMALTELEPVPIHELAAHLARDKSQMTRAIQALERKGYVARMQSEADARVSLLSLTDKGHALVTDFAEVISGVVGRLMSPLSEAEREQFVGLLRRI
ncbi:MAG: MarR family transcriptional regulator [Pseudomonadota bacterium]